MRIEIDVERWPLAASFRITGRTFTEIDVVTVTLRDGDREGRGQGAGVF